MTPPCLFSQFPFAFFSCKHLRLECGSSVLSRVYVFLAPEPKPVTSFGALPKKQQPVPTPEEELVCVGISWEGGMSLSNVIPSFVISK